MENLITMFPPQKDSPSTVIVGDISPGDVTVVVQSAAILPTELPFPLTFGIDKGVTETVLVTAINGNELIIARAYYGQALTWTAGTKCARVLNAADITALQGNIHRLKDGIDANNTAIGAEEIRATTAETAETDRAIAKENEIVGNLAAETAARNSDVVALQGAINTEVTNRTAALTAEAIARQNADASEVSVRQAADNDLQTQVDASSGQTRRFMLDFQSVFGTDTLTAALAESWLAAHSPPLIPQVATAFKNSNSTQSTYNHLFVFYTDPGDPDELILSDDGVDTVTTGSATSPGIVRGGGDVGIDINADMRLQPNTVTDMVIGTRTLTDDDADTSLVPSAQKSLTMWLQQIRNNLKALFAHTHTGSDGTTKIAYSNIIGTPTLGSLAAKNSITSADITDVGTTNGLATLDANGVLAQPFDYSKGINLPSGSGGNGGGFDWGVAMALATPIN